MFFYNPFSGFKDLPKKNRKQLSIVVSVCLSVIILLLTSLLFI